MTKINIETIKEEDLSCLPIFDRVFGVCVCKVRRWSVMPLCERVNPYNPHSLTGTSSISI